MKKLLGNHKFKNPIFWTSLISIIFATAGVDFNTLTSWSLLGQAIVSIYNNPVAILWVTVAIVGVFNDNGTSGADSLSHKR